MSQEVREPSAKYLAKPGYKQTEVGNIPKDWIIQSLKDSTDEQRPISYGIVQTGPNIPNGIPCLRVVDIDDGSINKTGLICTTKQISESYRRTVLRTGDLVMPLRGKVGDVGEVDDDLAGANLTRGVALLAIRPELSGPYCRHALSWSATRKRLEQSMNGSALQEIPIATLRSFQIGLPATQAEQRAIATALSDVDALLGGLEQLIAKKRDLKQAAMQQLLTGQTRLPGFSGEWEVKRLGNICRITTGRKDVNEGNPNGQFPFFTCSRSHTFSNSYSFDTEAILIAGNGEVGNLHYYSGKFEAYQRTYVLCDFSVQVSYLWQQLSANLAESLGLGKIGSSIPYIKMENLNGFEFGSPKDANEQTAIAAVLSDMDAELAALEARRDKTRALKQAMMQELLTGRTRLI